MRAPTLALALCAALAWPAHAGTLPSAQTAWVGAAADADVDRAFAQARAQHKPLLLYWGAQWCPPCNQLKATLFNRHDFIEQSQSFVAVYVDGDGPGAQKLGSRFKVRGYPTMILFSPDGQELTRLPGEVDAPQVLKVLQLGLASGRPLKAVLAEARAGRRLAGNEWRLLSYYAWDTDEQQLAPESERAALLASLATAAPDADIANRLWLKALAASEEGKGLKPDAALRERVKALLADPQAARRQMDVLVNGALPIVKALDGGRDKTLLTAFDSALQRLHADASLSRADRVSALIARVDLARLDQPQQPKAVKLPAALVQAARSQAARDDREITDAHERQAVITSDAYLLSRVGLWSESDQLLQRNLGKSPAPYYLMSQLASNAKQRGDKATALRWYEQAFERSQGPATRLQWGASYVSQLVELAPQDEARIEKAASQLFAEAAQDAGAFHERSARSLQRVGSKLAQWSAKGQHAGVMQRLRGQLQPVCAKLQGSERGACDGLLTATGSPAS